MIAPSVRRLSSIGYVSKAHVHDVLTSDQGFYQGTDGTVCSGVELMCQWHEILFTDESRFMLEKADGRDRVYRRRGERFSDACIKEADIFRGGSVMVWGGIRHNGKTDLLIPRGKFNRPTLQKRGFSTCSCRLR